MHARTEVERCQKYNDLLEQQLQKDDDLVKLIRQCLDNRPRIRPTAADIDSKMQVTSNSDCKSLATCKRSIGKPQLITTYESDYLSHLSMPFQSVQAQ